MLAATSSMSMPPAADAMNTELPCDAIEHDAEVELVVDRQASSMSRCCTSRPSGPVWWVTSVIPMIFRASFGRFVGIMGQLDATALAAPAGVNLRFDDHRTAERFGGRFRLFHRVRHVAAGHRNVILGQDGLCLILVNFHGIVCARLQKSQYIMSLLPYLTRLVSEENLPAADAEAAMQIILRGEASHPEIAAFLIALKMKGETVDELVGFARAMRQMAVPIDAGLGGTHAARYVRHRGRWLQHF